MIKKLIEKIFGKFCKCKEKTTSELLREGFDKEQEQEQDFSKLTKGDIKKLKSQGKKWY